MAVTKATGQRSGQRSGTPNNLMLKYFTSDRVLAPHVTVLPNVTVNSSRGPIFRGSGSSSDRTSCSNENAIIDLSGDDDSPETVQTEDLARKRKRSYEVKRHFQPQWAALHPWAQATTHDADGKVTQVRCSICSQIEGRDKLYVPKIDGLWKHAGRKRADKDMVVKKAKVKAGSFYFSGTTAHEKNERLLLSRPVDTIHRQIVDSVSLERKRKIVQFTLLFTLLSLGRPMTDFETMKDLFQQLRVPNSPSTHWSATSGWEMADSLFHVVQQKTRELGCLARFISVSADEVTAIDNTSWISVHLYVVKDWERMPILLSLQKLVDGAGAESVKSVIVEALSGDSGNLTWNEIATKLVSFGADGAAVFQGHRTGVVARLQKNSAPYMIGMHCCAHRTNLCVEKLDDLPIVKKIEHLCQSLYSYFAHSSKRQSEFCHLATELETEGNKILKNVKTRWISLLPPMQSILQEYRTLVAQMSGDSSSNSVAKKNAGLLLDLETFISFPCILPLLKCVNDLVKMAQSRHIMIQDFIGAVKLCQCELHSFYLDSQTSFQASVFSDFLEVVSGKSHRVTHEWMTDLETHVEYLSFRIGAHTYPTHWHDEVMGEKSPVTRHDFDHVIFQVKLQCKEAAQKLIRELENWFPDVELLNALGIVHPQFWTREGAEESFGLHMAVIKQHFCEAKTIAAGGLGGDEVKVIDPPLNYRQLLDEQSFFKLTMEAGSAKVLAEQECQPTVMNPMTRMWRRLSGNPLIRIKMGEWMKLAEIAIVTVIGSVEDERIFSNLSFIKSKLRNRLGIHLDCTVRMYTQRFFSLQDFPFQDAISHWFEAERRRGLLG